MPWVLLCAAVVATLPLRLFLRADINREPTFEIVIYLYGFRMQFEGLLERDASLSVRRGGGKNGVRLPLRALGRFFLRLLEVSSPARLEATCRLGTGDAFGTALAAAGASCRPERAGRALRHEAARVCGLPPGLFCAARALHTLLSRRGYYPCGRAGAAGGRAQCKKRGACAWNGIPLKA